MPIVFAFTNNKGGVAKTTSCFETARILNKRGFKCLVIDVDPQHNLSDIAEAAEDGYNDIYDVLLDYHKLETAIQHGKHFDFIATTDAIAKLDVEQIPGKEQRLRRALSQEICQQYDFILIDTPPGLGYIATNVLIASVEVIIPSQAEMFAIFGVQKVTDWIREIKEYSNSALKIAGVLITRYKAGTIVNDECRTALEAFAKKENTKVYKAYIRETTVVPASQALHKTFEEYDKHNAVTTDYENFVNELLHDHDIKKRKTRAGTKKEDK